MDLRLVLLLSCAFPIGSYGCSKINGCDECHTFSSYEEHRCPSWVNPEITFTHKLNSDVTITCSNGENVESFPGRNLDLQRTPKLKIEGCEISPDLSLVDYAEKLGMPNVSELTLRKIKTDSTLTSKNLERFEGLKTLDLAELGLPYLDEGLLAETPNLLELNLRDNRVNLSKSFFDGAPKLTFIDLGRNEVTFIPSRIFHNLKDLYHLNIWGNNITKINQECFYNLSSLQVLEMSTNPLEEIKPGSFDLLASLTTLKLSNVKLSSLPENMFQFNKNLLKVKMQKNSVNITDMPRGLLSYLPNLTEVMIVSFGLTSIPNDTFRNSTQIKTLDLSQNQLQSLPADLFSGLENLETLILQKNKLESISSLLFRDLEKLKTLNLERNQIRVVVDNQFEGLKSLETLNMGRNQIEKMEPSSMNWLESLRRADFHHNRLSTFQNEYSSPFGHNYKNFTVLNLSHNEISMIYSDWTISIYLKQLDLSHNNFTLIDDIDVQFVASNLSVDLSYNKIRSIDFNVARILSRNDESTDASNVSINISHNPIVCDCNLYNFKRFLERKLPAAANKLVSFEMDSLVCLESKNFTNMDVRFVKSENLVCDIDDCPNSCSCTFNPEKKANLVDCSNQQLTEAPDLSLFTDNRLIYLNLTANKLRSLPTRDQPNYNLVTKLYASHNQIKSINETNIYPNLTVLALDHNNLTILDKNTLDAITNNFFDELKLDHNSWSCNCDSRYFLNFTQRYHNLIPKDVVCSENGKPFFELTSSDICSESDIVIYLSVLIALIAIVIAIIAVLYYRYQVEIKIWLYAHQCCLGLITEDDLDKDKPYDAFISYSHKDEHFVVNELVKKLESGPQPYKLCLHFRDWLAGDLIPSQIARSVEDSKRTIIVLSKNFLSSVWGAMEFRAAHRQALIEGRARVIVVIYGDVPADNELDSELKAYLKMNTYVQWGDKWFWDKLRYAMPHGPKIKGVKKDVPSKNNNETLSPATISKSPSLGQSMLNMPTVSIIPKTDVNARNGQTPIYGLEKILNGSIVKEDIMNGITNEAMLKKDILDDGYHDTVNEEDDGGFNNRSHYGHIMFNFNNSHSTMV